MANNVQVVILAAGKGTRMKSPVPKVLHPLCGRPMIAWVLDQARGCEPDGLVLVLGNGAEEVEAGARSHAGDTPLRVAIQEPQLGTGHAMQIAAEAVPADTDTVVLLYGDMPLLTRGSLEALVEARRAAGPEGCALLTLDTDDPRGFGRVLRSDEGGFRAIVEERDATPEERAVREVNLGVYAFSGASLRKYLPRLSNDNAQGEYYVTDLPGMMVEDGLKVELVTLEDRDEALGVNTMAQLADARRALQYRILEEHMAAGVLIEDPSTTFIDHDVEIGPGTHVLPCTYIHAGVRIGAGCEVGPFTQLRVGTVMEDGAEVGNFTECKKSTIGAGSKAKHLSYIGDTVIGAKANIGAGTIFANYDGVNKHQTKVGDGAFVGSGTIVVAPNEVPAGSTTGAGAVVTRSATMAPGEVWIGMPARKLEKKAPEPSE